MYAVLGTVDGTRTPQRRLACHPRPKEIRRLRRTHVLPHSGHRWPDRIVIYDRVVAHRGHGLVCNCTLLNRHGNIVCGHSPGHCRKRTGVFARLHDAPNLRALHPRLGEYPGGEHGKFCILFCVFYRRQKSRHGQHGALFVDYSSHKRTQTHGGDCPGIGRHCSGHFIGGIYTVSGL